MEEVYVRQTADRRYPTEKWLSTGLAKDGTDCIIRSQDTYNTTCVEQHIYLQWAFTVSISKLTTQHSTTSGVHPEQSGCWLIISIGAKDRLK